MKKRLFTLLLAALLCLAAAVPALAAPALGYVVDEPGDALYDDELTELDALAAGAYEMYGIEVFFLRMGESDMTTQEYAAQFLESCAETPDAVLLAVNEKTCDLSLIRTGRAQNLISDETGSALFTRYNEDDSYFGGVSAYIYGVADVLEAAGTRPIPAEQQKPLVVDDAELLTDGEEAALLARLTELTEKYQCTVALVTVTSADGRTVQEFADDFYDYNGYGYGDGDDGLLFVRCFDPREIYISTYGYGVTAITDYGRESIFDAMEPAILDGDYARAFDIYADRCDFLLDCARSGRPYDVYSDEPDDEIYGDYTVFELFDWGTNILAALIVGVVFAFIFLAVQKRKLKSVRRQAAAADYTRPGSLVITNRDERFLYRNVDRRAKPKDNDGGGSSTHSSSSGRSHGGGGRSI